MIITSWIIFLLGSALTAWVVFVKARGSLNYWIRPYHTKSSWTVGRTFPLDGSTAEISQFLVDVNALVRSLDQSATTVLREWDHERGLCYVGLLMKNQPNSDLLEDYELREIPGKSVLRISGSNRADDQKPLDAMVAYAQARGFTLHRTRPARLSGQSFSLYQWETEEPVPAPSVVDRLAEWTLQLRDISVFALLLSIVTLGLLGTRQPALFAAGVGLIVFLSGACKFGFLHQRRDETQEVHLQNY
jgi:hypothetical protein